MAVWGIRTMLQTSGGQHSKESVLTRYLQQANMEESIANNIAIMDKVGTDIQFLSPRPFTMMHSHHRFADIDVWITLQNDLIHRCIQKHPTRFRGVAGLPQHAGSPINVVLPEVDRVVKELGFIGVLINPDPYEGTGPSPRLSDPYWFPLYEKLCEHKLVGHIHSAGCNGRETYDEHFATEESFATTSLAQSDVFERYPDLKIMVSHGGGSIPFQIGRWRSHHFVTLAAKDKEIAAFFKELEEAGWAGKPLPKPPKHLTTFEDELRKFYFDCDVHDKSALEHLIRTIGPDNCLLGTERPGSGGGIDINTGRPMDDFKYTIDRIDWLSDADRKKIYEGNARKIFARFKT
jgi:4-oxalmesaconate hydratase